MKMEWNPDDGTLAQVWDVDPSKLLTSEIEAIERQTGLSLDKLDSGSISGLRGLVWVMRRRHGEPALRWEECDFPIGWVSITDDEQETPKDATAPEEASPAAAGS